MYAAYVKLELDQDDLRARLGQILSLQHTNNVVLQ